MYERLSGSLPFAGNIEYNCQRLARTSINHAYFLALKQSAALDPFCKAIHWELSDEHFTRQVLPFGVDICDEYATHDEGLGVGNWPIDGVPLPHAQCLCAQWAETPESLEECGARLRKWLDGGEDRELESAYGNWKDAMISGMPNRRLESIRDDAGEKRQGLLERIAGRQSVKGLKVGERERLYDRLNQKSTQEIEQILDTLDRATGDDIIKMSDEQLGRKNGKHAGEWGLNPASEQDRERFIAITKTIVKEHDEARLVEWETDDKTKKRTVDVLGFGKDNDVVLLKINGEYITTMKDGAINNKRYKNGRRI